MPTPAQKYTNVGSKNTLTNKHTVWANVLGRRRYLQAGDLLDTVSRRGSLWLLITKSYWKEERDRRLEVVKLLTTLSYCVAGGSFIFAVLEHQ